MVELNFNNLSDRQRRLLGLSALIGFWLASFLVRLSFAASEDPGFAHFTVQTLVESFVSMVGVTTFIDAIAIWIMMQSMWRGRMPSFPGIVFMLGLMNALEVIVIAWLSEYIPLLDWDNMHLILGGLF